MIDHNRGRIRSTNYTPPMIPQSFVEINFGKIFNSILKDYLATVEIVRP